MGEIVLAFDTVAAAALATVCGWAVMSPRVHDGLVIKGGLILMSLGLALVSFALAEADGSVKPFVAAGTLTLAGMLVIVAGAALRMVRKPVKRRRRVTDWADLCDSELQR